MEEYLNSRSTISAMEQEWSLMRQTMALLSDKVAKLETLVRRVEWRVTRFQELREKHIELHLYPCGFELDSDTDDEEDGPRDADLIVVIAVEPPGCAEYVTGLRVVDAHGRPVATKHMQAIMEEDGGGQRRVRL
eukprot:g7429.t1